MAEKKSSARFSIQFNEHDSRHLQVMAILNAQGRHKAQYIANAILHYINCNNTPAIPQDDAALRQAVEAMVAEILTKRDHPLHAGQEPASGTDAAPKRKIRQSSDIGLDHTALDAATIDAINDSLAAFRSQ